MLPKSICLSLVGKSFKTSYELPLYSAQSTEITAIAARETNAIIQPTVPPVKCKSFLVTTGIQDMFRNIQCVVSSASTTK